mgnify:CR=1 FL=1|jgi:hypothetical protein|tara:strand:+ start:1513 stop:1740 length:228 start_codon:yes stop_codon:yes gene_type:complete
MGFLRGPKMPIPEPLEMPKEEDVPSLEDEAREREIEEDTRKRLLNRKGRRSTILTGTGLSDIEEENIDQKTLLGG